MQTATRNIFFLIFLSLLLCACQRAPSGKAAVESPKADTSAQAVPQMSLQLYSIPADSERRIVSALGPVLGEQGRVSSPAPGQILVLAPESMQPSIKKLLTKLLIELKPGESNGKTSGNIRIHFWLIEGSRSASQSDDPRLEQLKPALDELHKSMPQLHFTVRDDARMQLVPGGTAQLHTNQHRMYRVSSERESASSVRLRIRFVGGRDDSLESFETSMAVKPGQYVVLASVPKTTGEADTQSQPSGLRAVVMRADWQAD